MNRYLVIVLKEFQWCAFDACMPLINSVSQIQWLQRCGHTCNESLLTLVSCHTESHVTSLVACKIYKVGSHSPRSQPREKRREREEKRRRKKTRSPIKQLVSALLGQPSWPDVGKVKPKTNVSSGLSYHGQLVTAAVRVLQLQTGICRGKVHGLQVQVWRCKRALDSDNFWSGKNGKLFSSGQKKKKKPKSKQNQKICSYESASRFLQRQQMLAAVKAQTRGFDATDRSGTQILAATKRADSRPWRCEPAWPSGKVLGW